MPEVCKSDGARRGAPGRVYMERIARVAVGGDLQTLPAMYGGGDTDPVAPLPHRYRVMSALSTAAGICTGAAAQK